MEIFKVGDRVTWDPSMTLADFQEEKHGPGPFEITSAKDVNMALTAFGFGDAANQHPQVISISKDGKAISDFWSGSWFKKV